MNLYLVRHWDQWGAHKYLVKAPEDPTIDAVRRHLRLRPRETVDVQLLIPHIDEVPVVEGGHPEPVQSASASG